jgi:hypothetical protein
MAQQPPKGVSLGKFDILATYTYAKALLDGLDDDEAKQRGMVAAIMGAQARLGIRQDHHEEFRAQKQAAEKKRKTTITAESFDGQVAHKMGWFFDGVFLPTSLAKQHVHANRLRLDFARPERRLGSHATKILGQVSPLEQTVLENPPGGH